MIKFQNLIDEGYNFFTGVPDSGLKEFIIHITESSVSHIQATNEGQAIGIAVGMTLSKSGSLVFMQNAGFANSLSTITSLVQLYKIPIIFLIGWRGFLKNDAPEHYKIGKIQPDLIKALQLPTKIISDKNWEKNCSWAIKKIRNNQPCALVIKREFYD